MPVVNTIRSRPSLIGRLYLYLALVSVSLLVQLAVFIYAWPASYKAILVISFSLAGLVVAFYSFYTVSFKLSIFLLVLMSIFGYLALTLLWGRYALIHFYLLPLSFSLLIVMQPARLVTKLVFCLLIVTCLALDLYLPEYGDLNLASVKTTNLLHEISLACVITWSGVLAFLFLRRLNLAHHNLLGKLVRYKHALGRQIPYLQLNQPGLSDNPRVSEKQVAFLHVGLANIEDLFRRVKPGNMAIFYHKFFSRLDEVTSQRGYSSTAIQNNIYTVLVPLERRKALAGAARLALLLRDSVKGFRLKTGGTLPVTVTLHIGRLTRALISLDHQALFCRQQWFGYELNRSLAFSQQAVPNQVQTSEEVWQLLASGFHFTERGRLNLGHFGMNKSYLLLGEVKQAT